MFKTTIVLDCILLIRLLPALYAMKGTNSLKYYYSYRIATFWILIGIWVIGFFYSCFLVVNKKTQSYTPIIEALGAGLIMLIDYNFCVVVRRQLMRAIKKDRHKQRKIKGRMLSQKAHKGSVRIDTPPPFHVSNDHKSIGSRG